jgi:hypothetical protein
VGESTDATTLFESNTQIHNTSFTSHTLSFHSYFAEQMGKTLKRQNKKAVLKGQMMGQTTQKTSLGAKEDASKSIVKIDAYFKSTKFTQQIKFQKIARELQLMIDFAIVPKLGTYMRWIRLNDTLGSTELTARLNSLLLKCVGWETESPIAAHEWDPSQPTGQKTVPPTTFSAEPFRVSTTNPTHGTVMAYPPNSFTFTSTLVPDVVPVPFTKGAFVLRNILSADECSQFIAAANKMGFKGDVDYSFGFSADSTSRLDKRPAEGCFWLVDDSILTTVFERCRPLLPQKMDGRALAGLNARWRFYRYDADPPSIYRPHIDGSWPSSGIVDGKYVFDAHGDCWSCMTFLIYLNDDFTGGGTTFFTPTDSEVDPLNVQSVKPRTGNVLVFPHGTLNAALHEGSLVTKGSKFVMRSDVLYFK